jgi:hypothetical protein
MVAGSAFSAFVIPELFVGIFVIEELFNSSNEA